MKIKNIKVGDYIESKTTHGGDKSFPILEIGKAYKVTEIDKDLPNLPIRIEVPNHKTFGDGFWVHHENFKKPKRKTLGQSIFDGMDENWRFAAVDGCTTRAYLYEDMPYVKHGNNYWKIDKGAQKIIGDNYDASNWRNSLIERKAVLTGIDLCRAMLTEFKKPVMCRVSKNYIGGEEYGFDLIKSFETDGEKYLFQGKKSSEWVVVIPINNQDEPLTAKDVGL